jgi:hypothetical protein
MWNDFPTHLDCVMSVATKFLTHLFDKIFKNPKIAKNNENPKNMFC